MNPLGAMGGARVLLQPATPGSSGFDALAAEAAAEGHRFVARLAGEWRSGANRFDRPREALRGAFRDGVLLAVGGLNADPYLPDDPGTARSSPGACCRSRRGVSGAFASALPTPTRRGCTNAADSCPWPKRTPRTPSPWCADCPPARARARR